MTTIRREPPTDRGDLPAQIIAALDWHRQCAEDLAAGRHAVGCECSTTHLEADNACLGIAVAMRDLAAYEIEVET